MRVSVIKGDPGYQLGRHVGAWIDITLDGVPQTKVRTADEEQGYLLRRRTDAEGKLVRSEDGGLAEDAAAGAVVITLRAHAPRWTQRGA